MSINKSRFDIWAWLEKWGWVTNNFLTFYFVAAMWFATSTKTDIHWTFYVALLLSLLMTVLTAFPLFIRAKRSEAARKQKEQRQLQEVEEVTARWLRDKSQGAR